MNGPDDTDGALALPLVSRFSAWFAGRTCQCRWQWHAAVQRLPGAEQCDRPGQRLALDRSPFFRGRRLEDLGQLSPSIWGSASRRTASRAKPMGRWPISTLKFYVPPPRADLRTPAHPDSSCQTITKGLLRRVFPRSNPTLVDDPVQLHPQPRIGLAWRPFFIARYRRQNWLWNVREPRQLLWIQRGPRLQSTLPVTKNLVGAANAASSLQHPFPVLPLPSSFPNFVGAARSAIHGGSHPSARRRHRSGLQGRDDSAVRSGDSVPARQTFCSRSPTQAPEALTSPCPGATTNPPWRVQRILSMG